MANVLNSWLYDGFEKKTGRDLDSGGIIFSSDEPGGQITVIKTSDLGNVLLVDGVLSVTDKDDYVFSETLAHIPLFSHPSPSSVLIIGGPDGSVTREVLRHPSVRRVVTVEKNPAILNACQKFFPNQSYALDDFRVNLEIMDTSAFLDSCDEKFDVILIDPKTRAEIVRIFSSGSFLSSAFELLSHDGIMAFAMPSPFEMPEKTLELMKSVGVSSDNTGIFSAPCGVFEGRNYSFGFVSLKHSPEADAIGEKVISSGLITSFYNREKHKSSFSIPEPARSILKGMINPAD